MACLALPNFRKPWRVAPNGFRDDTYTLTIGYNFPVDAFDGKKRIIFSTTNSIGGDNPFVAGCYITVGGLSLLSGIGFFLFARMNLADRFVRCRVPAPSYVVSMGACNMYNVECV